MSNTIQSLPVPSVPSTSNQSTKRQPRGSINRRACQKCRHLKIKCDGDAENNISCSNCDLGSCVYDKSPRKNRQVERLNSRVESLEKLLMETQNNVEIIQSDYFKLNFSFHVQKLEKQILNSLFDCQSFFTDHPNVFNQLRQIINESRCWPILLQIIPTLLERLSQNDNNHTNSIIELLRIIAESSISCCNPDDAFNPNHPIPSNLIAEMNNQPLIDATTPEIVTTDMANLGLHSPVSDACSDVSNLGVPEIKYDLTSPLLTSTSNIEANSPHLTPTMEEIAYLSGSEYDESSVNTTDDFNFNQQSYIEDVYTFFGAQSYGSNSSNSDQ